jgi:antitoxin (DNA-binding transcriptional repressor) of toxin-antitoxin stability system
MKTITTHYAKTHLSRLLKDVQHGEEIVILNGQVPAGRLTAVVPKGRRRPVVGTITSERVTCAKDAFAPLDKAALKEWGL